MCVEVGTEGGRGENEEGRLNCGGTTVVSWRIKKVIRSLVRIDKNSKSVRYVAATLGYWKRHTTMVD